MNGFRFDEWMILCVVAAALLVVGCGPTGDDDPQVDPDTWLEDGSFESGKSDGSGESRLTQNLNAAQWLGYDPAFDRVTPNSCVDVEGALLGPTEPRFRIPTLRFIRTRQHLAEELGIDLKVGGSINVANAEFGLKMLNEFSRSADRVAFLLRVTEDFAVLRRPGDGGAVELSERGRSLLEQDDLNGFLSECGTHYVNGVRYGGEIDVLLTFSASEEKHLNALTTGLGADATGVPVELSAEVQRKIEESSQNLDISITTAASGFTLNVPESEVEKLGVECRDVFRSIGDAPTEGAVDSLLADLVAQEPNALPRLFSHIDCLKELMHVSMARDAASCRAEGKCTGNSAAPREVILEEYRAAGGSDFLEQLSTLEAERRRLEVNLDDIGAVRARSRAVYHDELAPFVTADQEQKARYASPMVNFESVSDIQTLVDTWSDRFSPDTTRTGDLEQSLTRIIEDCRATASNDLFHRCVPEGMFPEQMEEIIAVEDALAEYADTSRLVPLQVVIAPEEMRYAIAGITDANEYCEELGPGYRLPKVDEVPALDLLVSAGPVPGHTMWISDDLDECTLSGAFYDPNGDPQMDCSTLGSRGVVCVSPVGLFPVLGRP